MEDIGQITARIAKVVIEKKRVNPDTGELEVYERVVLDDEPEKPNAAD